MLLLAGRGIAPGVPEPKKGDDVLTLTVEQKRLAKILLETQVLQFGEFRLKLHETQPDAPLSPFYFNFRLLRSYPRAIADVASLLCKASRSFQFDILGDIPTAATPIVTLMSQELDLPMITPRKEKKGHGAQNEIDGAFSSGQRVLLVDDLITSGASKEETLAKLRRNGLEGVGLLVILDRQQGGGTKVAEFGLEFKALIELRPLLEHFHTTGVIDDERYGRVLSYLDG